jgi:hypothetical protein
MVWTATFPSEITPPHFTSFGMVPGKLRPHVHGRYRSLDRSSLLLETRVSQTSGHLSTAGPSPPRHSLFISFWPQLLFQSSTVPLSYAQTALRRFPQGGGKRVRVLPDRLLRRCPECTFLYRSLRIVCFAHGHAPFRGSASCLSFLPARTVDSSSAPSESP